MAYKTTGLNAIFGWEVGKQVRAQADRVVISQWSEGENVLSGCVALPGGKTHTCRLILLKETLAEGTCTCPIFRREHTLCVHLGLLYWRACGCVPDREEESSAHQRRSQRAEPAPHYKGDEQGGASKLESFQEIYYHIEFPKVWKALVNNSVFPILCKRVESGSDDVLRDESSVGLGKWLHSLGEDISQDILRLALPQGCVRDDFFSLLMGKRVEVSGELSLYFADSIPLIPVRVEVKEGMCLFHSEGNFVKNRIVDWGRWYLSETERVLFPKIESSAKMSDRVKDIWERLIHGYSATLPLKEGIKVMSSLQEYVDITNQEELLLWNGVLGQPHFSVEYKGHAESLILYVFVDYGKGRGDYPLLEGIDYSILMISEHEREPDIWRRNALKEESLLNELIEAGFEFTPQGWRLKGGDQVRLFWATTHELWLMRSDITLTIDPGLAKVLSGVEFLRPKMLIRESVSDEGKAIGYDWLSASYVFESASGDQYSATEILKLIRGGKNKVKLPSGKTALWDKNQVEGWAELMAESELRQVAQDEFLISQRSIGVFSEVGRESFLSEADFDVILERVSSHLAFCLHPYQKEGILWSVRALMQGQGALLGDDMGLGKTIQSLLVWAIMREREGAELPLLIVAPASLLYSWYDEVRRCFPDQSATVLHGSGREELATGGVVITTYGLLSRDFARHKRRGYGMMIFDEASLLRNPDTDAADAARRVPARYKLALSGTPIENSVRDLWSLFEVVLPGYLGTRKDFQLRYEKPLAVMPPDKSLLKRLRTRVIPWLLRRTKQEVIHDLPAKTTTIIPIELSPDEQSLYQSVLRQGVRHIESLSKAESKRNGRMLMLTTLLRLRQICDERRLLSLEKEVKTPSSKMEALKLLLSSLKENGHKTLVFSQFSSMLGLIRNMLDESGISSLTIDGSTKNRHKVVHEFQNNRSVPILLMSLKAGGYGLNLQVADTVIHVDPWWNPAVEAQATDRAYRLGQTQPVQVYKLICRHSVEEKILALQRKKMNIMEMGLSEDAPLMSGLTETELLSLLVD